MGYIIIEVPIEKSGDILYADFNKKKYANDTEIKLFGEPVLIQKEGENLILVYKAELIDKTGTIIMSNPDPDDEDDD